VAYSQSTGQRLWVSKTVPDSWNGLVSGGGGLFTWALGGQPGPPACYVQALAQDTGDQIWSAPCPSLDGDTLRDASLAVGPSNVFVRGNVSSGDAEVWEVGALARADGTQAWLTTFDAGSPEWWGLQALAASPDGSRVFATGTSNPDGIDRFQSVAFDASDGHLLWANTLRLDARPSRSHVLAVSTDGATVYAAGSVTTHCHYDDANEEWYCYEASRTVAYDASTGSVLWVRDMRPGTAGEVAVDPALNRVFVVFGGFDTVVAYKG
jgi:outer membrane protein assembly factor BamB